MSLMPGSNCSIAVPNVPNAATVADFVLAFTLVETVELSNLDSAGSAIDCDRINKALQDAYKLLRSQQSLLPASAQQLVDDNLNRWMLVIARYYLDTVRRRADVLSDYNEVLKLLQSLSSQIKATAELAPSLQVRWHTGKQPVFTQSSTRRSVQ